MRTAVVIILGLVLTGCAVTVKNPRFKTQIAQVAACNAWVSALNIATAYRRAGKLSKTQISRVDALRPGVRSVCESDKLSTLVLVESVESAVEELLIMRGAQ